MAGENGGGVSLDAALIAIDRACREGAVIRDRDLLESFAGDESEVAPVVPDAAVRATSTKEVAAVLAACSTHGVPVTPRAGGTGRVGGAVPVKGGIVLAFDRMDEILGIERRDLKVTVQPGVVLGDLHRAVEEQELFYPPDPNSWESCRIGGNLACNAGGPRAFKYGVTRHWVLGLEAVTAEGNVVKVGKPTAKGVTGYDLAGLIVGSEGTLAVVTEATLRLTPKPEGVATLLVFLPDEAAMEGVITAVLGRRLVPRCLEMLDSLALEIVRPQAGLDVPEGAKAMLLVELDGELDQLPAQVEDCGMAMLEAGAVDVLVAKNEAERERLWAARRELSHAMRRQANHKLSEDVVVPRTRLGELVERCRALSAEHQVRMPSYGHAGDGNLHVNFLWNDPDERPRVEAAIEGLFRAVVGMGGTLSGEHGIGVLKAPYLPLEQSETLIALQKRIKEVFDPRGVLNPGKIFPTSRTHRAC